MVVNTTPRLLINGHNISNKAKTTESHKKTDHYRVEKPQNINSGLLSHFVPLKGEPLEFHPKPYITFSGVKEINITRFLFGLQSLFS